jgi:hypothetical protein
MILWSARLTKLTSWSWALLEKLPIVQPLKNFRAFYGTRRFITVFTRALHWSLSSARSIQSITSHPISLRSILIFLVITNYLTPWSWALLEKPIYTQLLKYFPTFYGTRRFITMFTRALHWSLSGARSIQSKPSHPISLRSILILSTHLRLGLPSGLFASGVPTNILYEFLSSPNRATCPEWARLCCWIPITDSSPIYFIRNYWESRSTFRKLQDDIRTRKLMSSMELFRH